MEDVSGGMEDVSGKMEDVLGARYGAFVHRSGRADIPALRT